MLNHCGHCRAGGLGWWPLSALGVCWVVREAGKLVDQLGLETALCPMPPRKYSIWRNGTGLK